MKDPEFDRPIGDASLWLAIKLGSRYSGPEPEKGSPRNHDQEQQNLADVLYGVRFPRTAYERHWLHYMKGQREVPKRQKCVCQKCGNQFEAAGFPSPNGESFYPNICTLCADLLDAPIYAARKPKKNIRAPYVPD